MNRASVDRDLRFSYEVLGKAFPQRLGSIFTPQHGLWSDAQANMIETPSSFHHGLGIPIHSLYSETRRPTEEMLQDIDTLVVDLQDAGTRIYTFIWTMLACMRACAQSQVNVVVLDRPNPVGGLIVEGPVLDPPYRSFVGDHPIPMRHALSIGEVARLFQSELQLDLQLDVVPMVDWSPESSFIDLQRTWLPPSPNLPTAASTLPYVGQVLLEGTSLSEGRGTTTPFEMIGAPGLPAQELAHALNDLQLPGVRFLPTTFRPTFDKFAGQDCGGISLHCTSQDRFRPFQTTVEAMRLIQIRWPQTLQWLAPPYEYEAVRPPIDILYGSDRLRVSTEPASTLSRVNVDAWHERVDGALIYPRKGFLA
ncbi:MAG: exo-beta-N-acetylmuramidase NamZ family protein [Rubripirellula sp.]